MSKSCNGKVNKTRYVNTKKPMKQTSFTVKNLGGNLPEKQSTIVKRSFRFSTKPLSPVTIFLNILFSMLVQLVNSLTALKTIILYVQGQEKRRSKDTFTDSKKTYQNFCFFKPRHIEAVEKLASRSRAHGAETAFLSSIDATVELVVEL